jgi:glycosyltransferase involved in cell wall biosynthesis
VSQHIAAFDMALQPNVVAYASPLKIFEYLAMGKPTIAPDVPNIREILSHDVNAILFDPTRDDALGRAVVRLCEDEQLRHRLGAAGSRLVLERNLTWQHNARTVVGLMQKLCGDRG